MAAGCIILLEKLALIEANSLKFTKGSHTYEI